MVTVNRKKAKYRKIVRHNLRNIIESRHLLWGVLCAPQIEGYCEITTPYLSAVELLPTQIIFIDCTINKIQISAVVLSTELSNRNHFDNSLSTLYLRGELLNSERFVMPSAGQTLTNLAVFDASSHFPRLCKIDASSSYIQIWETTPLLLIFDYFTSIL